MTITHNAQAQDLSTRERQALSAKQNDRVMRRDLLAILRPAGRIGRGMLRRMHSGGFATKPYVTEFRGLCRYDVLFLKYGAADTDDRYEDAPLRPYGLETASWFYVDPPSFGKNRSEEKYGPEPFRGNCASRSTDGRGWFGADSEQVAARGYAALAAARKRFLAGSLKPTACRDIFENTTCEKALADALDPAKIDSIRTCDAPAQQRCLAIDSNNNTKLTIRLTDADDSITPESILSMEIEQYIIIT